MLHKEQGIWDMAQLMNYLSQKQEKQSCNPQTLTEMWNICDDCTEE